MVVVMTPEATDADIEAVAERVRANGGEAFVSRGTVHTIIGLVGDTERFKAIDWRQMQGVDHVIQIGKPYKMVSRDLHPETTVVKVGTVPVGRDSFTLIAGPCAVENPEQTMRAIRAAKDAGATIVRGDVYKPRTSPYSFQGLGERGIEILQEARREFGLPVVDRGRGRVAGRARRGRRRLHPGRDPQRPELRAVERGRAREQARDVEARSRDDRRGVAAGGRVRRAARQLRDHPVRARDPDVRAVDPQHPRPGRHGRRAARVAPAGDRRSVARRGKRHLVAAMARASLAAGADGVMVDVHANPEQAMVDGAQALLPEEVIQLGGQLAAIAEALGRPMNR